MSPIETQLRQVRDDTGVKPLWSVEDVSLHAKKLELDLTPELSPEELLAVTGLLNEVRPTPEEEEIRWEVINANRRQQEGNGNPRYLSLSALLRSMRAIPTTATD